MGDPLMHHTKDVTNMADSLEVPTTDDTRVATGPDRSIPQQLIDLAILAIKRGAHRVDLIHEGLGYEFPAPIGWLLWIHRFEHGTAEDSRDAHKLITHQVGSSLERLTAPEWLALSAADGTPDAHVLDGYLELFEVGVRNGWEMSYIREQREHGVWNRTLDGRPDTLGMRHVLKAGAPNWARNAESDEPTSITLSMSVHELEPAKAVVSQITREHTLLDRPTFEALVQKQAPWFAPVAYADEALEEWVL